MIEFAIAAALVLDPGPKQKVALKAPTPAVQSSTRTADAPSVLAGVAVTLECTARANGHVENCTVLGETHPGLGFGDAAIALMRDAEVDPSPRDFQFARTIQFTP